MPVITVHQSRSQKRGAVLAITAGVVIVLLTLPLAALLLPEGVQVGGHGVSAHFYFNPAAGPGFWAGSTAPWVSEPCTNEAAAGRYGALRLAGARSTTRLR